MKEVLTSGVFDGTVGKMTFSNVVPLLTSQMYKYCGVFLKWSIFYGGPGLPVLLPASYFLMVNQPVEGIVVAQDIAYLHLKWLRKLDIWAEISCSV